ncbi:MAG: HU family DNA-binding protein [Planctomycetota bacterium]
MAKAAPAAKPATKTQILQNISEETELSKKDVAAVFDALSGEIEKALKKGGPGQFAIPGLCKIVLRDVPAKPKRKGRNPANGEEIWLAPKPASKKLAIRPLKALKDMI